jgi:hypothetical protein
MQPKVDSNSEVHKSSEEWDWNNSLKAIWVNDNQHLPIYSNDHAGHYWDSRNIVDASR